MGDGGRNIGGSDGGLAGFLFVLFLLGAYLRLHIVLLGFERPSLIGCATVEGVLQLEVLLR